MLLYYQPWMFYMHYYAILYDFWDQPINLEPSVSFCFFLVFKYHRKGKIKRSPIDLKLHGDHFWTRRSPRSTGDGPEESGGHHEGGARPTPWLRPLPHGRLGDPPDLFPTPTPLIYT